ncbi:hypothetical protein A0256_24090 [Mucilaginibacter sp. PAMC 26640]|nr:hypothetical protein A0256_24090 [Mucilaginibacter sp. PAMC 26640]
MRAKKGCLLLAFIVCFIGFCGAQNTSSSLRGNIFLENNTAADAATAILLNQSDSAIVKSALVNNDGKYIFKGLAPGKYLVLAYRLGYTKAYSANYTLAAGQHVTVPPIYLITSSTELKGVAVIARKPLVEVRPGKTIINPQASITADGKNVLEILAQSPGVRVDNDDNVSISGRQNALILIDGKTTNMTGSDLTALLKGTQGANVEKIELISGGAAQYDAAAGGVINIILKKGKNIGTNGTINLTAGYGKYYKSMAGFTFNNRSKFLNIYGSYNANANKTFKTFTYDRNINTDGIASSYNLNYYSTQETVNHNYRLGADFLLSAKHTLGLQAFGFFNDNSFRKNNTLKIANNGQLDSMILVNSNMHRDLRNINYNINYSGKLDTSGKMLSAAITYSPYNRQSDEFINNAFLNNAGTVYRQPTLLQNLSPSHRINYTGVLDYINPLNKTTKLELGIKISHTSSDNNLVFGPRVNGVYTVDPNFSNSFRYTENVNAGYVNYNATYGKVDLVAGARGEFTKSEGVSAGTSGTGAVVNARNYFKIFPSLLLTYRYNDKNEYSLSFTRGILRPDYESLNPFLYYVDPYNYQSGNPFLKPEYTNSLKLTHNYNQTIATSFYANFVTDANFTYYQQNDTTKVSLTTTRNVGKVYVYGVNVNAPVTITKWWNVLVDADASYQHYKAYPENGNLDKSTGDLILSLNQSFSISSRVSAEISSRYETPNFYGVRQYKSNYYVNAGISTQVFGKRGKLSLNVADIFNTNRDRAYININNLDLRIIGKPETRIGRLSFSYRFGKGTVKGAIRHDTGNEGEQDRMRKTSN